MNATIDDIFQKPDYAKIFKEAYLNSNIARPQGERAEETLLQHSEVTLAVFDRLVLDLGLEPVFKELLFKAFGEKKEKFWYLLRAIVYFHDFGKMNDAFQMRMDGISKKSHKSDHALPGLFLFGTLLNTYLKDEDDNIRSIAFFLSSAISRHHTYLESPLEISQKIDNLWENKNEFKKLLEKVYQNAKDAGQSQNLCLWFDPTSVSPVNRPGAIFRYLQENLPESAERREAIFYLHKLLYSCLVSADYYAAFHGEVPKELSNTLPNISELNKNLSKLLLEKKSNDDISKTREKFREYSHQKLKDNKSKNVFYLYLPTGGGKTLTSLSLALELAEQHHSKRLFYVFPYVNIIEQNKEVLGKALGAELVSPIYSYSEWDLKENEDDEIHFINQEFTNYPVVVLSNVNFFNALIKSGKSSNYKLHNFANSVIVIDEIQSLNAKEWTLYNDLITNAAKMLNSKIIVMSASIPPIHKLTENRELINKEVGILIEPNTNELQEHFKKFWNRVDLILEQDENGKINEKGLVELAIDKINLHNKPEKVLLVANTIKKSFEAYSLLRKNNALGSEYDILLLNSTMLSSWRQEIIARIKPEKPERKLILVSTQSVEAGLDVDFDLGIRELAPLDNLLQVCGRVNRNMKKPMGQVYVATKDIARDSVVYGDLRFRGKTKDDNKKNQKQENMQEKIKELLIGDDKDMDSKYHTYSDSLVDTIKKQNRDIYRESQRHSVESLLDLDFESLNEHNVIEQSSVSIFVPLDVDISNKPDLIKLAEDEKNGFNITLIREENVVKLPSKEILEFYKSICKSKDRKKNVSIKKFAPLLNQFIISISFNRAHKLGLYTFDVFPDEGKKKYSTFLVLTEKAVHEDKIYSLEEGLRIDKLEDNDDAVVF